MKTKLKDILLYSFAAIGVCSLFIAASNSQQQTTSTVPESHAFDIYVTAEQKNPLLLNKVTGMVWEISTKKEKLYEIKK